MLKRFLSTQIHSLLPKNSTLTRVRIWQSGYYDSQNRFIPTNVLTSLTSRLKQNRRPNIGHVSLETCHFYASLWPTDLTIWNKLHRQEGIVNVSTPTDDEIAEERPPDYLIDLQTLDVNKIKDVLDRFIKNGSIYHLLGENSIFKYRGSSSCSGLAFDLLLEGGIRRLAPESHLIREWIVKTPNNLISLVVSAEKNEKAMLKKKSDIQSKDPSQDE